MDEKLYSKEEIVKAFGNLITEIARTVTSYSTAYYALPEKSRPTKEINQLKGFKDFVYFCPQEDTVTWGALDLLSLPNACAFILYCLYNARIKLSEISCMDDCAREIDYFVRTYFYYVHKQEVETMK